MVVHRHILVNGKKIDIPSYSVSVGDVITLKSKSKEKVLFKENFEQSPENLYPYIEKSMQNLSATLTRLPERHEIPIEINDHLIVEFYSRLNQQVKSANFF